MSTNKHLTLLGLRSKKNRTVKAWQRLRSKTKRRTALQADHVRKSTDVVTLPTVHAPRSDQMGFVASTRESCKDALRWSRPDLQSAPDGYATPNADVAATGSSHPRQSLSLQSKAMTPSEAQGPDQAEGYPWVPIIGNKIPFCKSGEFSQFGTLSQCSSLAYLLMSRPTRKPLRELIAANFKLLLEGSGQSVRAVADNARKLCKAAAVDVSTLNNLKGESKGKDGDKKGGKKGATFSAVEAASIGLNIPAWMFLVEDLPADAKLRDGLRYIVETYMHAHAGGRQSLVGAAQDVAERTKAIEEAEATISQRVLRPRPSA
jgi:hypothetical protein